MHKSHTPKVALVILDGWGVRRERQYNAILQAHTPHWDQLVKTYGQSLLSASGEAVGLPRGQMGNSEVGHMHIGTGQLVPQDLLRINETITANQMSQRLQPFIEKKSHKRIHLLGLYSNGGIHAHAAHWHAVMNAITPDLPVYCHLFADGRDTSPKAIDHDIVALQQLCAERSNCQIASLSGRYYAMDRDERWERTDAWFHMMHKQVSEAISPNEYINDMYAKGVTDEFLPPVKLLNYKVAQDDLFIILNFRADRVQQLLTKLNSYTNVVTMTAYSHRPALFPKQTPEVSLGALFADAGLSQIRIAETEKFAHITYFLNGGNDQVYSGESRTLVPSPKVATYDQCPEMAARGITVHIKDAMQAGIHGIFANYANADMVGHTGNFNATIQAIECLDECIGELVDQAKRYGYRLAFCADHGNAEWMWRPEQEEAITSHTCSSVPFVMNVQCAKKLRGSLIDIAPTLLDGYDIELPKAWQGRSLLLEES